MATMDAISRAAGSSPPDAGMPPGAPAGPGQPGMEPEGGVEALVQNLSAVGEFLKAQGQNPAAQQAMSKLQELIQSLMQLSGGAAPEQGMSAGTGRLPEGASEGAKIL